ncbi:MAG: 6-phosphofructokinase [Chloroflexota bacterium]|nr:6-phosphofructokinase [Chloroflexota bacterium]
MKKIGVLTSGGDAPGMNACIRAVVRSSVARGIEVVGIRRGYRGLIEGDFVPLGPRDVSHILEHGGTILGSSRCDDMKILEGLRRAADVINREGIDGLVAIGGDGTFRGAHALYTGFGVKVVGVPGTIDNDVYGTDYTIGFDTAVNNAVESIDKIRDTADSHDMVFFIEVMGRHRGFIAVAVGIACGAEEILIPEVETDLNVLAKRIEGHFKAGKKSSLVIVTEGDAPGGAQYIANEVGSKVNHEYRVVQLGHVQRGGSPTANDRILASELGAAAVDALTDGVSGCMVGKIGSEIVRTPLEETWSKSKELDLRLLKMLHIITI